jgi:predicted DNA-binding transcriptional regulator AlpA
MVAEHEWDESAPDNSCRARRMLNERQVLQLVPVSPSTLYRMEKTGRFPKSTYVSPNRRLWFEDEVVAWQASINGRRRGRRGGAVSK